ncbi:tetratricopeptide repeat protein [Streptomyces lydicus]|uniref:tetratricopeptide repeat protein n=1 Tax=Streptomyces lydicus TaxID=47763 RepID=UPI001011A8D2|nr:hypothetical protein [Streptomyces lydicus]MCZ1012216.1 hypothetical protein [Streptomyces lydicus]
MTAPSTPKKPRKSPNLALRGWLKRSGMTYEEVAIGLRQIAARNGRRDLAPGRSRIGHWANDGEQPREPIPSYLAHILTHACRLTTPLTPADLNMNQIDSQVISTLCDLCDPSASLPTPGLAGDPTKRRTALTLIGGTALTPLMAPSAASAGTVHAYAQHAAATELAPGEPEELELAVQHLGAAYSAQPPRDLWRDAAAHRHRAFTLLHDHRHTLREGRDLSRHAGMLSVILAWIAHDLGRTDLVEAFCIDAGEQAKQADAPEVHAWAEDVRCTDALYDGRDLDALTAATRGLAVAPRNSDAAVRLTAQLARTQAKLGNSEAFADAAGRAHRFQERLPLHGKGLFGVDAVRIVSYDASSHRWLGDNHSARKAATEAIDFYKAMPNGHQAPTRLAIAQLDLALAHTALGEPDAAIVAARQALSSDRLVHSVLGRAKHLDHRLRLRYPTLPLVTSFSEEVHALTA